MMNRRTLIGAAAARRRTLIGGSLMTLTLPLSHLLPFFAPSGRAMMPSRLPV
jgi:hypothetical protein